MLQTFILEEHSKGIWALKRHSKVTWQLKALGQLSNQRALGYSKGTRALNALQRFGTQALQALEGHLSVGAFKALGHSATRRALGNLKDLRHFI